MNEGNFANALKIIEAPEWLIQRYGADRKLISFFMIPLLIYDAIGNNALKSIDVTKETHFGKDTVRVSVIVLNDKSVSHERYFSTYYNLGVFQFMITEIERIVGETVNRHKFHYDDESKLIDEYVREMQSKYAVEKPIYINRPVFNATRSSKKQMTYIMMDEALGYYKIGKSENPMRRERTLQAERPVIKLIAITEENIEATLHHKFKERRIRGEWFDLSHVEVNEVIKQHNFKKR
jgi:hypothetical protein